MQVVYINKLMFWIWHPNETECLGSSLHLLDMKRKIMMGRPKLEEKVRALPPYFKWLRPKSILAATQLKKAGITFKKTDGCNLGNIKFDRANGVLTLPHFHVTPTTEIVYLNVSAFERLHMDANQEVSSFVDFMACLVQCADDARLLKSKGIIVSTMTTYRDVARFVQKLRDDMNFMPKGSFYQLRIEVEEFYWSRTSKWKKRLREWRSNFRETHFKSPWSLIALCAASLLLLLTIEQSVFTTLSYYKS